MSIEKKSLISNRTATKKALVTKPEVTKVASTRMAHTAVRTKTVSRIASLGRVAPHFRIKVN